MLTPRFIIGFTGHRHLDKPEPIAAAIRAALEQLRDKAKDAGGEVELFTSIAYGADTLAAEVARSLGIPVHIVLPKPIETDNDSGEVQIEQGFAADFWNTPVAAAKTFRQVDWDRSWRQIQDARQGVYGGTLRMVHGSQSDPECYYDAGVQVVSACDALIAVWDGEPARDLGGTAEMVMHIRTTEPRRTVLVIDSASGVMTPEHLEAFASASELQMREIGLVNALMRERCAAPSSSSEAVYQCLSTTADEEAKKFRSSMLATIVFHGGATIIAALAAILPNHGWGWPWVLTGLALFELILVVRAWRLSRQHEQRHTHERWLRARFGAELVRGLRAAAAFLDPLTPQISQHKPRWTRFALSTGLMAVHEVDRSKNWQQHREEYVKARLADQFDYFTLKHSAAVKTVERTQRIAHVTTWLAPWCVFFALGVKTYHAATESAHEVDFTWSGLGMDFLVRFLPIAIPLVAGIAGGLRAALDATRRHQRFNELASRLHATSSGLSALKTETTAHRAVAATEEVLLDELVEWHLAEQQNGAH